MPVVLLFDVDGTLVDSGGAGRRAMVQAFERTCSAPRVLETFSFAGMTDRGIARRGLELADMTPSEPLIDQLLAAYLEGLDAEVAASKTFRIHEGARRTVMQMQSTPGVALGLGTGNIRLGARAKLHRAHLFDRFSFGGYGCDAEARSDLLRIGARRGAAHLGVALDECDVVVLGDTPRDVIAAHDIGARCVAVTTGPYDAIALGEAGADLVVASLDDSAAVDAMTRSL